MNILFMSLGEFENLSGGSVHIDVAKELSKNNNLYLVCKREKRTQKPTEYTQEYGMHVLRIRTGNVKRTSLIQKGINTIRLEDQFLHEMKKYLSDVKFDLIIYTTPPITFVKPIRYFKNRDHAKTYLMLKDIFPQNAVDLGMLSKTGIKAAIYYYFRRKEKTLYALSDYIGCMSPANIKYILDNNPEISPDRVEEFPNCINIQDTSLGDKEKEEIRKKYNLPEDKTLFVYGGNLGKPQGVPFLLECMKKENNNDKAFFIIVGGGTEYDAIQSYLEKNSITNTRLIPSLPKDEYEKLVSACDVGMIFLDHRFTIPNFPARTLSYMQSKLPVLAVTDPNTDVGQIIENNGFGWWTESNDTEAFHNVIAKAVEAEKASMGEAGYEYLLNKHDVSKCCKKLLDNMAGIIS